MIFEVREVLEGLAARRAATLITPQQVEHQARTVRRHRPHRHPCQPPPRLSVAGLPVPLPLGILEIAGSQPLHRDDLHSVNILVLAFGAGLIKSIQEGLNEHAVILEALLRRDPDAAEAAMRAHVRRSVVWLHNEADLLEAVRAAPRVPLHADNGLLGKWRRGPVDWKSSSAPSRRVD